MGKSACAQLLQWRGAAVVDADELARKLVAPDQPALAEIREDFGRDIVGPDGQLKRGELAQIVFGDATARAAGNEAACGQSRNTSTRLTSKPAIMAPVSWPYWPRMPQPIPPARAASRVGCQMGACGVAAVSASEQISEGELVMG